MHTATPRSSCHQPYTAARTGLAHADARVHIRLVLGYTHTHMQNTAHARTQHSGPSILRCSAAALPLHTCCLFQAAHGPAMHSAMPAQMLKQVAAQQPHIQLRTSLAHADARVHVGPVLSGRDQQALLELPPPHSSARRRSGAAATPSPVTTCLQEGERRRAGMNERVFVSVERVQAAMTQLHLSALALSAGLQRHANELAAVASGCR